MAWTHYFTWILMVTVSCVAEIPKERYYPEPGEFCKQDYYMTMEDVPLEEARPVCEPCKDREVNEHPESSVTCHKKRTTTTTAETEPPPTTSEIETTTTPTTTTIENQTTRPLETPNTTAEVTTTATKPSTEGEPATHQPEDKNDSKKDSGGEDKSWTLPWWGAIIIGAVLLLGIIAIGCVIKKYRYENINKNKKTKQLSAEEGALMEENSSSSV